jgi:hypothetical protein
MGSASYWYLAPVLFAVVARLLLLNNAVVPRNALPKHLLGHPIYVKKDLITPTVGEELVELVDAIGLNKGYPTNTADVNFYHTEHEHVGEATAAKVMPDGRVLCDNPFLIPSMDRKQCVLAGRMDIGRHLILTGGARGLREKYEKIISRVQSFGAYHFDLNAYPAISRLFADEKFLGTAKMVCPADKQHLDPFQFNFIIQIPGQTVATHIDGVYFKGASRFQFPQWLLAAMKFSGMWDEKFVDQVQVVGYLHRWEPTEAVDTSVDHDNFGSFIYWNNNDPKPNRVLPHPLSGSVVDGSKVVHAASVYRMEDDIPLIDKSIVHWLKKESGENDRWTLTNERDGVLRNYSFDDLRISIVYRARCFANDAELESYRKTLHGKDGEDGRMSLDGILEKFLADLIAKGKLAKGSTLESVPRLDLALMIMDVYIKYPLPSEPVIPWNYCALGRLIPALNGVLGLVC